MNRLTERIMDNVYYLKGKYPPATLCAEMETWEVRGCMVKLAAYEDTGLEPEEIKDLKECVEGEEGTQGTVKDLIELMQYRKLEKQGLLIKLPCKVGDIVYEPNTINYKIYSYKIEEISFSLKYGAIVLSIDLSNGIGKYQFKLDSVGRHIFLTREEAKKALKEMEGKQ